MDIKSNVPLAGFSSWLVGGLAEFYVTPENLEQLKEAVRWARQENRPITLLAGGTNVLISDQGVPGLVIHLKNLNRFETLERDGRFCIETECGVAKAVLLKHFLKKKLTPALFLAGLPGDVGGGVVMNAGVSEAIEPREFGEITDWIEVLTFDDAPALRRYEKDELTWSYRHCDGWRPGVIYRAGLSWPLNENLEILRLVKEANRARLHKQPLEYPSCGSVFKNPPGAAAGRLIDTCGLRGFKIGGAMVSEKHANFIVNSGNATAEEIDRMIRHVQKVVRQRHGIDLTNEVVYLGLWSGRE